MWDMYIQDSLKDTTRQKRGTGIRRRVAPPRNGMLMRIKLSCSNFWHNSWCNFLLVKEKLFMQLTELFMYHDYVHTKKQTLIFSFMLQMQLGKVVRKLHLRTVDTDVVVLAIAMFNHLNADELWLAFGTKSHFRYNLFMKLLLD